MKLISGNSWLFDDRPNWVSGVSLELIALTNRDRSISGYEQRQSISSDFRVKLKYTITATDHELIEILRAYDDFSEAVFFAPCWATSTSRASFSSRYFRCKTYIAINPDGTTITFDQSSTPDEHQFPLGISSDAIIYPLLTGVIQSRVDSRLTSTTSDIPVEFSNVFGETISFVDYTPISGPLPSSDYSSAPELFPGTVDFDGWESQKITRAEVKTIGTSRVAHVENYQTTPLGSSSVSGFSDGQSSLGAVFAWFQRSVDGRPFWFSNRAAAAIVSSPIGSFATNFQAIHLFKTGQFGVVHSFDSATTFKVSGVDASSFTSDAALTIQPNDIVSRLELCSLDEFRIVFQFFRESAATWSVSLISSPLELANNPTASESVSVTFGKTSARFYLYKFSDERSLASYGYTSNLSIFTYDSNSYSPVKITHSNIKYTTRLTGSSCSIITTAQIPPLIDALRARPQSIIRVIVYEVNADTLAVAPVFSGELGGVSVEGSVVSAEFISAQHYGSLFPRVIVQRQCNHSLFDFGCSLDSASFRFSAIISNAGSPGGVASMELSSVGLAVGPTPVITADYFAGGYIKFSTGNIVQIISNSVIASGVMSITLDVDPNTYPSNGEAVSLWPGCDLNYSTCKAKFNNGSNFLGFPNMPIANQLTTRAAESYNGGKK